MKTLYINANPKEEKDSIGLVVGSYLLNQIKNDIEVINLYEDNVPLIDSDVLSAWSKLRKEEPLTKSEEFKVKRMNELLEQFMAADEYIIVTPLWNLSITPMLKAYLDNVVIAGKTFSYTDKGPKGLLSGKKAVIIQASGGIYSKSPGKEKDFSMPYLMNALEFVGVADTTGIYVEGTAFRDNELILEESKKQVNDYIKKH